VTPRRAPDSFQGFSPEAFDFFVSLAANNQREWFQEHRGIYERACREPMRRLVDELAPQGHIKLSRINRDMRFAYGRPPYRTYIAAGFDGNYISLSERGVFVGTGLYRPAGELLDRFRQAVGDPGSGTSLAEILTTLRGKEYIVDAHEWLKRVPHGYPADHPRAELLRMKGLFAGKTFGPTVPWISTRAALDRVRDAIGDLQPLAAWMRTVTAAPGNSTHT
jgi:uncharacterized protein (TIGR02453 family)